MMGDTEHSNDNIDNDGKFINISSRSSIVVGSSGSRTLTRDGDKKDHEEEQEDHDGYEFLRGTDLDDYSDWKEGNWRLRLPANNNTNENCNTPNNC